MSPPDPSARSSDTQTRAADTSAKPPDRQTLAGHPPSPSETIDGARHRRRSDLLARRPGHAKTRERRPNRTRGFRSGLEARIAEQLRDEGVRFTYEKTTIPYVKKNGKVSSYTPDFHVNKVFYVEAKGYFVGRAADRLKLVLVKEQHPELDLRLVFEREGRRVSAGSSMTYADWADAHGFQWTGGGALPSRWIEEATGRKRQ
jgi:hypothetical protein